jgi:hypothetical protein
MLLKDIIAEALDYLETGRVILAYDLLVKLQEKLDENEESPSH